MTFGGGRGRRSPSPIEGERRCRNMKWRVQIRECRGEKRLLRDLLKELSIEVIEQEGELFLISDVFESMRTAGEVHAFASRIQSIDSEIGEGDPDITMNFQVGYVCEALENGQQRKHIFLAARGAAFAMSFAGAVCVVQHGSSLSEAERKRIEEEEKERAYQGKRRKAISRFVPAFRDDRALQVQRLLKTDLTPLSMGHIVDLIQADGSMKNLISRNQQTRFYRSINHPNVFGEQARHIVSEKEPPPKPMSLDEAREFTRALATRWLEKKAGLPESLTKISD
jgi:hypothetical protein